MKLWYGDKDVNIPVELGYMIYEALRGGGEEGGGVSMNVLEGWTHASVIARGPEMLRELIGGEGVGC